MARKKARDQEELLTHFVRTRVTAIVYSRLDKLVGSSDCHSIGEVARRILSQEQITVFTRDTSLDLLMEPLSLIHRDIHAIGVNINQITRYFHGADSATQKSFHALKVAEQYSLVGRKVDTLNDLITTLSSKWLQK